MKPLGSPQRRDGRRRIGYPRRMEWLVSALGLVLVAVALRDIFHTLYHPQGFGRLAHGVFRVVWWVTDHVWRRRSRELAGPLGVLGTGLFWTALVVLGWTLVYFPHMPEGFNFGTGLTPEQSSDGVASLYLSLVTVATLGYGDIIPADPVLRILTPLQALVGFVLLTAAISWILQIYPALGRRRSAAKHLSLFRSHCTSEVLGTLEPSVASQMLTSVTREIVQLEADLVQYPEVYYFQEQPDDLSLAVTLPYALDMAESASTSGSAGVRLAAGMLGEAVESLALHLDRAYLRTGATAADVLESYAKDHRATRR